MRPGTLAGVVCVSIAFGPIDCLAQAADPEDDAGNDRIGAAPVAADPDWGIRLPSLGVTADAAPGDSDGLAAFRLPRRAIGVGNAAAGNRADDSSPAQIAGAFDMQARDMDYLGAPNTGRGPGTPSSASGGISGGEALARLVAAGNSQAAVWMRQLRGNFTLGVVQFAYRAMSWVSPGSRRPMDLRLAHPFSVDGHRAELSLAAETIDVGNAESRPGFPFQRRIFLSVRTRF